MFSLSLDHPVYIYIYIYIHICTLVFIYFSAHMKWCFRTHVSPSAARVFLSFGLSVGIHFNWSYSPWLSSFRASGVDAATEFYGRRTFSSLMQFSGLIKPRQRRCYSSLCYVWENEGEGKRRGRCYSSLCYIWENEGEGRGRGRCYSSLCYV